jgi:2-polyprenyl-3-methyl-5-hydroxy-6-metoxy-1,4-benzoquinol methylase
MDQPDLDPQRHVHALQGLARINWISSSDRILWGPIEALARRNPDRPIRVLDIATGGGDVPIRLWRRVQRSGLKIELHGADISPVALDYARGQARQAGADITFSRLDILNHPLPTDYDVLMSSLFLHHLSTEEALGLLTRMGQATRRMVLVNDLIRSRFGYTAAWLGTRALSTSHIVHVDGPLSVEAAFTMAEARALADQAGLTGARMGWRWPWRFLLEWSKPA